MKGSEKLCQNVKTAYTPTGTTGTSREEYNAMPDAAIFILRTVSLPAATIKAKMIN